MKISSNRLDRMPKYLFAELEAIRDRARRAGREIINLGIGDPDLPTPGPVIDALAEAAGDRANHQYPTNRGMEELRVRAAGWFEERFGVVVDPESEILILLGSKEGLAHLPLAVCDSGDTVLVPDPGYPVYHSASILAGADPVPMPLREENGFLPDVGAAAEGARDVRVCFVNYPNNPTGAVADLDFYNGLVDAAARHGFVAAGDAAYSEITYDGAHAPSLLQVDGAKEVAVEFHSLSKTFNMTGWRVAFAVGNAEVLRCLEAVKSNVDSGVFKAVQRAAIAAFNLGPEDLRERVEVYQRRRDLLVSELSAMGCEVFPPRGAFYVWARTPSGYSSMKFAAELLEKSGVSVAPGTGFGAAGEGYFRVSLTVPDKELKTAMRRMGALDFWSTRGERTQS
jgi:LL-diaminopimelate aminotransferase